MYKITFTILLLEEELIISSLHIYYNTDLLDQLKVWFENPSEKLWVSIEKAVMHNRD